MTNIELLFKKLFGTAKMDAARLVGVRIETVDRRYNPVTGGENSAVLCWLQMSNRLQTLRRDLSVEEHPFFTEYLHNIPEGSTGGTIGDFLCGIREATKPNPYTEIDYKIKK